MKKNILLIHTGGTISMSEDQNTGSVIPSNESPLLEQTGPLENLANIIIRAPFNLPSPHISSREMMLLKELIQNESKNKRIDGVVITHGTDTLEETAYFLDLTLPAGIPVVITGAMRSSNEVGSDGLYNVISAIRTAADDQAVNKGVLVVLNDEIHTARNVTKTHTSNVSTFQSPQYGPIGIVTKQGVFFHHAPNHQESYDVTEITKKVALLKAYAGMDASLLFAIKDLQYDGVVIEALGQGNLPPAAVPGIQALIQAGIPIVLVSRCFNGIVQGVYGYTGGGKNLKDLGVIFSNGLNGQKARIKLLIALSQKDESVILQEIFQK